MRRTAAPGRGGRTLGFIIYNEKAVWAVVSDVTRMPEWSPELRRLYVLGGAKEPRVGMTLLGINRRGYVAWPTTSRVTRFEPGRAVAWKTRESGATWTYELEPTATGTRLTGRRDLPKFTLGTTVLGPIIGGAEGHGESHRGEQCDDESPAEAFHARQCTR